MPIPHKYKINIHILYKMANSSNKTRKNKKIGGSPKASKSGSAKASPKGSAKASKSGSAKASPTASPKSPDDVCSICLGVIDDDKFKPTKNLIRPADSHSSRSVTDKELNTSPEGANLTLHRFKTKCGHTFHTKCIGMWCNVRSGVAKLCPYCNQVIDADCKDLMDVDSIGIMPYLKRMFFHTTAYGREDVDKKIADNDAVIQRYLDTPRFDPNVVDENSNTPLHIAVERRRLSVIKNLLARKEIDTNIRNSDGKLAIEIAMERNDRDAIAAFKKSKKVPKALKGLL